MQSVFALAALAPLAYAFTQPTEATFGSLLTPDLSSVRSSTRLILY